MQEPRRVAVFVSTDVHDQNKQLARLVCTYPSEGTVICREVDTGKPVSVKRGSATADAHHSRPLPFYFLSNSRYVFQTTLANVCDGT